MDKQWSKQEACFARATQVWLAFNHNTSIISGKRVVSHAAVNQIYVIHEAMNGCKNLDCFENVNIYT